MSSRGPAGAVLAAVFAALLGPLPASAQAPAPPTDLVARDGPNDDGRRIVVSWKASPSESPENAATLVYRVERAESPGGPWTPVDSTFAGSVEKEDSRVRRDQEYFYRVSVQTLQGMASSIPVGPVQARSEWINSTRWSVMAFTVAFFAFVLFYMASAQAGRELFVRRIPGIDAIEQAIGRATEMGRPVLYIPGIQDIDDIQTLAGLVILESVARLTAKYETPIVVPVTYPIPFAVAEEMVKSGYLHAGRPDQYDPNSVRFVSPEQFAYVAAVTGIMTRDKPAAHLMLGSFYAESLLLAETGFATGAIQVAGTANVHQLPFMVVACDYTLIGEELFAASAYLSREPRLMGGLKGADLMKIVIIVVVVVGCLLETFHISWLTEAMRTQ